MSRNDAESHPTREASVLLVRLSAADLATLRHATEAGEAGADALVATWTHAENPAENPDVCELEGAFAGVHFLLTGTDAGGDGPLAFIASPATGEPMTTLAGVAGRVFEPAAVAAIADAIESLSARSVRQRLASDALAAVTPFDGRPLDDEDKEWLLAVLQALMVFVRRAATDGVPLLVARI